MGGLGRRKRSNGRRRALPGLALGVVLSLAALPVGGSPRQPAERAVKSGDKSDEDSRRADGGFEKARRRSNDVLEKRGRLGPSAQQGSRYASASDPPDTSTGIPRRSALVTDPRWADPTLSATSYAPMPDTRDASPAQALERLPYVPGRLIVRMRSSVRTCVDCLVEKGRPVAPAVGSSRLDELNRRWGLRRVRPLREGDAAVKSLAARRRLQVKRRKKARVTRRLPDLTSTYVFKLSRWLDMERVAREYERDPAVKYAEPDRRVSAVFTPNDPYFSSAGSWGQPFDDLWGAKVIGAPVAWDVARGAGVVVAVTDTGVDTAHPDMDANMWANPGETGGGKESNGIDDDGNGYVDDQYGWNFVGDTRDVQDDHGHGTHTAGTVAAVGDNGIGVIGVAWRSKIMALKGLNSAGSGSTSDLAEAIVYAAENGADVINASWGGFGTSQVIDDAIETADQAGVVFVAAAGNSNRDVETSPPFFPAANPRAVTVSASDHLDQKASFSNFGTKVDVAAPGGGDAGTGFDPFRSVLSLRSSGAGGAMTGNGNLVIGGEYLRQAGTSMAAPHVAGAAAVLLSAHPAYTPSQVRQALRAGADDVGDPGFDIYSGYGRTEVSRSLGIAALASEITDPASGFVGIGSEIALTGTAAGDGFSSYTLGYGAGTLPTTWTALTGSLTTPVEDGELGVWDITAVPDGDYVVRLRTQSTSGATFEDRVRVTLDRLAVTEPEANTIMRPSGALEIRGSAAGGDFQSFRVERRVTGADFKSGPWTSDGITLAGGGTVPVFDGPLATLDTAAITENADVDFRVVITRGADEIAEEIRHVVIDPTLRAGWPQQLPGLPDFDWRLLHHMTIADLDDDGTKEILVAFGDMVYAFRHDGTLVPGWPRQLDGGTAAVPFNRRSPAAADLDGDGRLEVVVADAEAPSTWAAFGDIYAWHHDGTPMTGWPKKFNRAYSRDRDADSPGGPRGDLVLSDVDGDGRRDIVAVVGPSLLVIDVDGNMLPGWPREWPEQSPCVTGNQCYEDVVAVGDVDGNGKKEIAVITADIERRPNSRRQTLLLYSSTGEIMPGFPRRLSRLYGKPYGRLDGYINAPVMADIDGDRDLEIIAMTNKMRVRAYHHTGRRARVRPGRIEGTKNRTCRKAIPPILEPPTAGDLDGDGRAEILISSHTMSWMWKPAGRGRSRYTFCLAPVRNGVDYINVLRDPRQGNAAGWPVALPYPAGDNSYGPGPVAVGDIDGDLRPDVVSASGICGEWDSSFGLAGHRCFTVNAYDASGSRLPGFPKSTPGPGTTSGVTPAIGDLDGDGLKEIVWVDFHGNILVWDVAGTPAPETMQWPMFRHDSGHTGALVANP